MDSSKPLNIGVILFPTFQALDAFGPLDALNVLSTETPLNLFILAETLDPVSTAHTNPANSPFNSNFSQSVVPTHTFATAPPLDVLLIPGGQGRRDASTIASVSTFAKERYPSLKYVITVCTGAFLISQAGILDGKRATTNKKAWSDTKKLGPKTHWIAKARWVVDGNIWTAAGVSAGIDVTLAWIGAVWGEQMAEEVALIMEYSRAVDSSADPFADRWSIADVIPES